MRRSGQKIDFSKGPVWKCIIAQAVPLTIAQLVQLLYNVVDRIYIGHIGDGSSIALTGVGLTFPIVTLIMAFTALFGMGGSSTSTRPFSFDFTCTISRPQTAADAGLVP